MAVTRGRGIPLAAGTSSLPSTGRRSVAVGRTGGATSGDDAARSSEAEAAGGGTETSRAGELGAAAGAEAFAGADDALGSLLIGAGLGALPALAPSAAGAFALGA